MKENILITGTNGYLQNHISHFLKKNDYNTNCISLRNNEWKKKNFKEFDTAIHLAGIVHQKKSINLKNYIDVNARLTYDFAKKCKADGIRHFIFFSTMSVYGENGSLNKIIAIKNKEKKKKNFKEFDTANHLAGIVHQKKSINLKNYIDVNARLTYDFAKKCKADGIRHFIFFSTMSVYGENGSLNKIIAIKDKEK